MSPPTSKNIRESLMFAKSAVPVLTDLPYGPQPPDPDPG